MKHAMAWRSKACCQDIFRVNKRNTIQRQLVLDAVRELNIHATAEQAYEHVTNKHPSISRATVYRNLNQLAETGELLNIGNFYGSTHYDHNCHRHYHFVCEKCRRVYDMPSSIPDMSDYEMDGFEIKGHNLSFHGLCRDCALVHTELSVAP